MLFEPQSLYKKILFITSFVLVLGGAGFWVWQRFFDTHRPVACTEEARVCPDGSAVGRVAPMCFFAECPGGATSSHIGNKQLERAMTDYLLMQPQFSWTTRDDSFRVCGVENLEPDNQLFPLSVWVYCGEYRMRNGALEALSGSSGPAMINYPNELSFFDPNRFTHQAPGGGAQYVADVRRIFSASAQERIGTFEAQALIKRTERFALENELTWESIKQAIATCDVREVFQAHDRTVQVKLKNGAELRAVEPEIDMVMEVITASRGRCGDIVIGIE